MIRCLTSNLKEGEKSFVQLLRVAALLLTNLAFLIPWRSLGTRDGNPYPWLYLTTGERGGVRTLDTEIKSLVRYHCATRPN